jgi:hypothetical protein
MFPPSEGVFAENEQLAPGAREYGQLPIVYRDPCVSLITFPELIVTVLVPALYR